jgi:trans-2,3-dihydro-3-hydroxyanthranilate isomerase
MGFDFTLVDVFTDRPFGGNQLAVFPDAEGIPDETMQRLAREFNFSETTFVLPPGDPSHTCRVRIFTPYQELPFAGHPTLGTAAVLARLDQAGAGERRFVFEEGIGPVTVTIDGQTIGLHLHSPDYEATDQTPPAPAIAKAIALPEEAIADSWYAGVGLRFCFVRLTGPELVDRASLDKAAWQAGIADSWSPHLYVFAGEDRGGGRLHARFFAPAVGVEEDPATGSACAVLVASLAQRSPEPDGTYQVRIDQGVAMGRPSKLEGTAHKHDGRLTEVVVSGQAAILGHGTITLPTA